MMRFALLVYLLALTGDNVTSYGCQLCPEGTVYPIVVDCGAQSTDFMNTASHGTHETHHLGLHSLLSLLGRKRRAYRLSHCHDVQNYPNAVQVNHDGKTYIKINYFLKLCAFVPIDSMKCSDHCCDTFKQAPVTTTTVTKTSLPEVPSPITTKFDIGGTHQCDKLGIISSLAHSQTVAANGTMCSDRTKDLSEAVLLQFCNATISENWRKGYKVIDHCNDIPPFTAIAAFSNTADAFSLGSISGVLISCTDSEIKIASEDCNMHDFSVFHVIKQPSTSYIQNAENYYTIRW